MPCPKKTKSGKEKPIPTAKGYKRPPPISEGKQVSGSDPKRMEWLIGPVLGHGGFGDAYAVELNAKKIDMRKAKYVLKVEPKNNGPLFMESKFYRNVAYIDKLNAWKAKYKLKHLGIPTFHDMGFINQGGKEVRFIVIQRLGDSFEQYIEKHEVECEGLSSIAVNMIRTLEYVHDYGYTHGDIKEDNILLSFPDSNLEEPYLIDFGLTSKFMVGNNHRVYSEDPKAAHDGTLEYTSRDSHRGASPSRRSDLEILGFCLFKWFYGALPWGKLRSPDGIFQMKERFARDGNLSDECKKIAVRNNNLNFHAAETYLKRVQALDYEEKPDYTGLVKVFLNAAKSASNKKRSNGVSATTPPKGKLLKRKSPEQVSDGKPKRATKRSKSDAGAKKALRKANIESSSEPEDLVEISPIRAPVKRGRRRQAYYREESDAESDGNEYEASYESEKDADDDIVILNNTPERFCDKCHQKLPRNFKSPEKESVPVMGRRVLRRT